MRETLYERLVEDVESCGIRDSNGCLIWRFSCANKKASNNYKGYGQVRLPKDGKGRGRQAVVVRIILHLEDPSFPIAWTSGGLVADHSYEAGCRDTRCIDIHHIQAVTQRTNTIRGRLSALNEDKTSQYVGVYWDSRKDRWISHIQIHGVRNYIGRYLNEVDAHQAYEHALLSA